MNTERFWCRVCNKMVAVVIEEAADSVLVPVLGTVGGALGASKGGLRGGVAGVAIGFAVGALAQVLVPDARRLVCGGCGHHVA